MAFEDDKWNPFGAQAWPHVQCSSIHDTLFVTSSAASVRNSAIDTSAFL